MGAATDLKCHHRKVFCRQGTEHEYTYSFTCKFCTNSKNCLQACLLSKILQLPRCTSKVLHLNMSRPWIAARCPCPTNPSGYLEDGEETSVSFTVGQLHATALWPQGDGRPILVVTINTSKPWWSVEVETNYFTSTDPHHDISKQPR